MATTKEQAISRARELEDIADNLRSLREFNRAKIRQLADDLDFCSAKLRAFIESIRA
jgi:hypothetical protein